MSFSLRTRRVNAGILAVCQVNATKSWVKRAPRTRQHELVRELGLGALDGNEIKRVYTATTAQGHGVGTAIMSHLEAEARLRGLDYIEVEASPTSVTFYKRLGYKRIRPGRTKHGDAVFTFVIMRKMLE